MKRVTIRTKCVVCTTGAMVYNNKVLPVYPPRFEHQCNKCGCITSFLTIYPKEILRFDPEEEVVEWE